MKHKKLLKLLVERILILELNINYLVELVSEEEDEEQTEDLTQDFFKKLNE